MTIDYKASGKSGSGRGKDEQGENEQGKPSSVLVYQIGSLGDTLVSVPAYRAVRRHFGPRARIRVLHNAPPAGRASPHQVLDGSGLVDEAVTFRQYAGRSTWKTWLEVWVKLRRLRPDAVAYLAPAERSAQQVGRDRLFFRLCGIPRLIGFQACDLGRLNARGPDGRPAPVPHEAVMRLERLEGDIAKDRTADMSAPLLRVPAEEQDKARAWLAARQAPGTVFAALCPGANQPANFWPLERFEELGRRLSSLDGIVPLVIGGPAEREMGERLLKAWGRGVSAAGEFSVLGSAALLGQCRFLVGLDTGTTHLAAALGVPCVTISGERNPPGQWTPLGPNHVILRHPVPCAGCGHRVCPVPDHPCMTGISTGEVWAAILEVNARTNAADTAR